MLRLGALILVSVLVGARPARATLEKHGPAPVESVTADGSFRFSVETTTVGQAARLERKAAEGGWETVWATRIRPVASRALVSDDGRYAATFSRGYGPEAVVVYGADGRKIRALSLLDFLTDDEIRRLPIPRWGRGHRFEGDRLVLRVVLGTPGSPAKEWIPVDVSIDLPEVRVLRGDGSLEAIGAQRERCAGYHRAEGRMSTCRAREGDREWCRVCLSLERPPAESAP